MPVDNTIQLVYNPDMDFPSYDASEQEKQEYWENSVKEPDLYDLIICKMIECGNKKGSVLKLQKAIEI